MSQAVLSPTERVPRVAFVSGTVALGGAVTFLCNIAGELARRKIPVEVHSFEPEHPLSADFARLNVPVTLQKKGLIHEDRLAMILRRLAEFKPSVVIANLGEISFEVLRYVPKGVFRVAMAHSDHAIVYNSVRHYADTLDLLGVVSETIRKKFKEMPEFANVPVRYVPYGVPMPATGELPKREFSGPLRILYVGRIAKEQKRVQLFPQILAELKSRGVPFHWTIAGEGPELDFLKQEMKTETPNVSFTGPLRYSEIPDLLARHDLFLLASDYEGLPLTLLEAMGSGMVPVVSDLPSGIREVVDESNGRRIDPANTVAYAEAIAWLHKHRDAMSNLSQNARRRVWPDFSLAAMADRWLGAFPHNALPDSAWPCRWNIRPMLGAESSFRYSRAGRIVRRILHRFRH